MKTNKEIEFKTKLNQDDYKKIIALLRLKNPFTQTNYYFDTNNFDLLKEKTIVRIREKSDNIKITLKKGKLNGSIESHSLINDSIKSNLLKTGFNLKTYFRDYDCFVQYKARNQTERFELSYRGGMLFIDKTYIKNQAYYELEFEHDNYNEGLKIFKSFLEKYNINYIKMEPKSLRTFRDYNLL